MKRRRNPWKTKADVARHNKACAGNKACTREWLRVANSIYDKYGESGAARAVIAANSVVKRKGLKKNPKDKKSHIEIISGLWRDNLNISDIVDILGIDLSLHEFLLLIQEYRRDYGSKMFPRRPRIISKRGKKR